MTISYDDLPDWRDASAYPKEAKFSPSQWAWEFLRRREDYRTDWQEFHDEIMAKAPEWPLFADRIANAAQFGGVPNALADAAAIAPSAPKMWQTAAAVSQLFAVKEVNRQGFYKAHKWFLPALLDPRMVFNNPIAFKVNAVQSETGTERKERIDLDNSLAGIFSEPHLSDDTSDFSSTNPWTHEPFQLHLTVDMRVPIGVVKRRILEEIDRGYAQAKQFDFMRIGNRKRADKYPIYLRALDAVRAGASVDEIGDVLYRGQFDGDINAMRKQVTKAIQAGKDAQEDYWQLAHLE